MHVDNWQFLKPEPVDMEPGRYRLPVKAQGVPMGVTQTLLYGLPVLSGTARDALQGMQDVEAPYAHAVFAPVDLIGPHDGDEDYFLLIVETFLDCVDEDRSEFRKFEENDPVRPDKAGEYAVFTNLVVDPARCEGRHFFRLAKCMNHLIVSEEVKRRLEASGIVGAVFDSVNGDQNTVA